MAGKGISLTVVSQCELPPGTAPLRVSTEQPIDR